MICTSLQRRIFAITVLAWKGLTSTLLQMSKHSQSRSLSYSKSTSPGNASLLDFFVSGNILKPSLDLVLFTSQLSRSLGLRGTVMLFSTYYATVSILRAVTPAFGKLAAVEARLEGEYRAGMGRIDREAEEIA